MVGGLPCSFPPPGTNVVSSIMPTVASQDILSLDVGPLPQGTFANSEEHCQSNSEYSDISSDSGCSAVVDPTDEVITVSSDSETESVPEVLTPLFKGDGPTLTIYPSRHVTQN